MDHQRWQQVEQVFLAASDLPSTERSRFLDSACGNDLELRHEVESLIAADLGAHDSLEAAIVGAARGLEPGLYHSDVGRVIGSYELIREIGRGGMGAVFMAIRSDRQFEHVVAIKLVRRGMDSDFIISRFLQERQILANLHHPNIAAIVDGGTTDDGRPYFVMEYIEGLPIVEYCETHQLGIDGRLEIFREVCSAVHYAHQKLVIHRDLKPGNILVTSSGKPKLLDFGISKLLASDAAKDNAPKTLTSVRLMTPDYASPEQVRGDEITTASDVYTLGALLYELLTGRRPYSVTGRSTVEIERAVCQQDPLPPSEASKTAPKVRKQLAGDLDNIVLMAMRKEPSRRYGSAEALSEDILRYLKGLPVAARKDTIRYRMTKLMRRHKAFVVAASLLALSLVGGLWSTYHQARRAENRFQQVRRLANAFLFDIHDKIRDLPGSIEARQALVATALEYLDSLANEAAYDESLQFELASAYLKVGDVQGHVLSSNLGRTVDAMKSYNKALALATPLLERGFQKQQVGLMLATTHGHLGENLTYTGKLDEAATHFERSAQILEEGLKTNPNNLSALQTLSRTYRSLAAVEARTNFPQGLKSAQKAAEAIARAASISPADLQTRSEMAVSLSQIGNMLMRRNDLRGALEVYSRSRDLSRMLVERKPDATNYERDLMIINGHIGDILGSPTRANLGDLPGAIRSYDEMLRMARKLASDSKDRRSEFDLAVALMRRANAEPLGEGSRKAASMFMESIAILEKIAKQDPQNQRNRMNLAFAEGRLGARQAVLGDRAAAAKSLDRALRIGEDLVNESPDSDNIRTLLGIYWEYIEFLVKARNNKAALVYADRGMSLAEKTLKRSKGNIYDAVWIPRTYTWQANVSSDRAEACRWREKALAAWDEVAKLGTLSTSQQEEVSQLKSKMSGCALSKATPAMSARNQKKS
ncbi:MAG TPA: serine/threonine-protein kinase [Bryobacteraceae bacterium]|jgi:serine/threonine protein kinase|nr:serine/threonine-protein kinase [Bryobacteraceae bacterium]